MITSKRLQRYIIDLCVNSNLKIDNPFWDIEIKACFYQKERNITQSVNGFYDGINGIGENEWKIRWRPTAAGLWSCSIESIPRIEELCYETELKIEEEDICSRGNLRINPSKEWKFNFDNDEPFFLLGDTMYNLFGAHYCQTDIKSILLKRKQQGVNYIRVRMQNSTFHTPIHSSWMNKDCWPWGGSPQWPNFKEFNLDYFKGVDEVMQLVTELGIGLEVIFEAWMLEFPFNDRAKFIAEYEELWFKYIIARYSAFPCVYLWCPANEYEFYPEGTPKYHSEADRWMKRMASFIKQHDPYKHPIGVHNWGEERKPLTDRMCNVPDLDVYLVQTDWVKELFRPGADLELCAYLEEHVKQLVPIQDRATMVSEFGYEMTEGQSTVDIHELLNHHHTRRGQWRAGFAGYPVVHGFNNTWGPHMNISNDSKGADYLIHYYRFMTEEIKFYEMHPNHDVLSYASGRKGETMPSCLSNSDCSVIAIYFPTKGDCEIKATEHSGSYSYYWYNPRNGTKLDVKLSIECRFETPGSDMKDDWVLLIF